MSDEAITEQKSEPTETIEPIVLDLTKLVLNDIPFIDSVLRGEAYSIPEAIAIMERCVVGGVGNRPVVEYRAILTRFIAAVRDAINPKKTA